MFFVGHIFYVLLTAADFDKLQIKGGPAKKMIK